MIDIELIRRDQEAVKRGLATRGTEKAEIDDLRRLDAEWRTQTAEVGRLRHAQRAMSASFTAIAAKKEKSTLAQKLRTLADRVQAEEERLRTLATQRTALWKQLPNLPLPEVPVGTSEKENVVRSTPKELRSATFPLKEYSELGDALGIIDTAHAAQASGTRFGALVGDGVRLEFALVQHALTFLSREGFLPLLPPVLIKRARMDAMGYLERGAAEVYQTQDNLVLVGTSEQAVGAMFAGHAFEERELPARFVAFSSCFRREAGSHGRDVRGILRVHQFDKVEMFSFCHPSRSREEHAAFVSFQTRLMDDLGLATRVVDVCAGDMGFAAAALVDLETWFPARRAFVETHSASNTTDFQTRRLGTKFRGSDGRRELVHAVNGTAYAIQRTVAALLETHQEASGSVRIPDVLQPYLDGRPTLDQRRHGS